MSSFHSVVTEQKVFICAVCTFIERLLRAVLPDIAWDNTFLLSEEKLGALLDEVIRKNSLKGENEGDCCIAMAQAACNAMKHVCDLLKMSCAAVGLQDVAGRYLDGLWFVRLLMNKNTSMLNKLLYGIDFTDEKPSRILMNVAAILNGRTDGYDGMRASAKRKATNDTKKIIDEVQKLATGVDSIHQHIDESKTEIIGHVDEVGTKVESARSELHETKDELLSRADAIIKKLGNVSLGGKRKGRHTMEQKKVCLSCWMSAQTNEELKSVASTGKATREAAFNWYHRELELVKVFTLEKFIDVLNTVKVTRSADQKKKLFAKQEALRKAKKPPAAKCGIIRGMKRTVTMCVMLCALMRGEADVLPSLPEPVHADTEISTNVQFNAERSDAREFGVEMSFTGTASNCVQVAFGRDADGDGDLSPEETGFALGWRGGSYFIEDVARGDRLREGADMSWNGTRSLSLHVALDGTYRPRSAAATNESGACFLPVTSAAPDWLYGAGWNLMKVTRRGVDATAETVGVDCRYRFFTIRFM